MARELVDHPLECRHGDVVDWLEDPVDLGERPVQSLGVHCAARGLAPIKAAVGQVRPGRDAGWEKMTDLGREIERESARRGKKFGQSIRSVGGGARCGVNARHARILDASPELLKRGAGRGIAERSTTPSLRLASPHGHPSPSSPPPP